VQAQKIIFAAKWRICMKILIATDMYKPQINGVVTSVENLRRGLAEMGHEVMVLTLSDNLRSRCETNAAYIGSVGAGRVYPNARLAVSPWRNNAVRELARWKPDVVHTQCEFSTFAAAKRVAAICGAPLIHTYHTLYESYTHYFSPSERLGKMAAAFVSKKIFNATDAVIAPTEKIRAVLCGYGVTTPITTVPTGVDLAKFSRPIDGGELMKLRLSLGINDADKVLVFVGRLGREKNVGELLTLMKSCDLNAKLLVVGDGPYRRSLEETALSLGIMRKVIFAGMAEPEEVAKYYRLGDAFVSASSSETQGLTYLEAMASGLPLLCRRDRCLDELLSDGAVGFQFDTAREFQEYAVRLLCDSAARSAMGESAAKTAAKYSIRAFAENVMSVYENALSVRDCRNAA
jgi:1,2-diacylglycerol 3-alpha-glucosyltransferase